MKSILPLAGYLTTIYTHPDSKWDYCDHPDTVSALSVGVGASKTYQWLPPP